MAKELTVGETYNTKNNTGEIDFTYRVIEIKENKVVYKIISNRSNNICMAGYLGIKMSDYNLKSSFVRNSEIVSSENYKNKKKV